MQFSRIFRSISRLKMKFNLSDCAVLSNGVYKSISDKNEYRLISLPNGIRAMLISDVTTAATELGNSNRISASSDADENDETADKGEKMAGCVLCVHVGSFSDPPNIPGLAHFVEHMVFMGSEKYPKENAMDDFIRKRGGSDNASTDCDFTTFEFECREDYLEEGMDIFSQFFIAPLMLREAMTREREAIDSEFEMALPCDASRVEQLLASLAPSGHPSNKFHWGNLVTLRDNIDEDTLYKSAHEFRKKYYAAQLMTLTVAGRLPLDTLEKMVRDSFSSVPGNDTKPPDFSSFKNQFGKDDFHSLLWVRPANQLCSVTLSWVLPSLMDHLESRPIDYLGHIIGHEGEGSLISHLRKKLWCLECCAGNDGSGSTDNAIYSMFTIELDLTDEGINHLDEVLLCVFQYFSMLRANLPDERTYEEIATIARSTFKYKYVEDAVSYGNDICLGLHINPRIEQVLLDLYLKYDPEIIRNFLHELRADNVNVLVQWDGKPDEFFDSEEPWFKVKYRKESIPKDWINSWEMNSTNDAFFLPPPNPYITRKFDLYASERSEPFPYPEVALRTELMEVWYKQDRKFNRPVADYRVYLQSRVAKATPLNALLLKVLCAIINQKLKEEFYAAAKANYAWSCQVGDFGLLLYFAGFDENLPLLYENVLKGIKKVCDNLSDPENKQLLKAIKKDISRDLYNAFIQPKDLTRELRLLLLMDSFCTSMDMKAEISAVTLEALENYTKQLFDDMYVKILIEGNTNKELVICVAEKLPKIMKLSSSGSQPSMAVWKVPAGKGSICRVNSFGKRDKNAVITNYFQSSPETHNIRTNCIIELIIMAINEPLFDSLRTKQQIGYDISATIRDTFGILAMSLTVHYQFNKFQADEVNQRVETFLNEFLQVLRDLPAEEFEAIKTGLVGLKRVDDLNLSDECRRFFAEITSGEYIFNRIPQEIEIIPSITIEEVISWYETHVCNSETSRMLSVQVHGAQSNSNSENGNAKERFVVTPVCPDKGRFIENINNFRSARELYPPQKQS